MKTDFKCPECSGADLYVDRIRSYTGAEPNLLPQINRFFHPVDLEVYVCGTCGYYQCYVPSDELKQVQENWQPHIRKPWRPSSAKPDQFRR